MKASRPIRDFYKELKAEERVRLWRGALERGDTEDAALLLTTCPRQTGSFRDLKFAMLAGLADPTRFEEAVGFVEHTPQPFIVEIRTLEKTREEQEALDAFRAGKAKAEQREMRDGFGTPPHVSTT